MIKTILVPLDGSSLAEQGLAAACRIARETGATLLLVRAVFYFAMEEESRGEETRDLREAREYLDRVQQALAQQGFAVITQIYPVDPLRAILFAAEVHDVDLISICTQGRSGLRQALLGSVAQAVLHRSAKPVLLTRAAAHHTQEGGAPFGSILAALDGTTFAESTLAYLRREGIGRGAKLLLLRAVAPVPAPFMPSTMGDSVMEGLDQAERETEKRRLEGEAYLQAIGLALPAGCTWRSRVMIGDPGEVILRAAESEGSELIVIATHGRHGWDRLLHGSVARHLLHHADVPLLILHGSAAAGVEAERSVLNTEAAPLVTGTGAASVD
jgi:nucleotide-binding universal stress UspA family protein